MRQNMARLWGLRVLFGIALGINRLTKRFLFHMVVYTTNKYSISIHKAKRRAVCRIFIWSISVHAGALPLL